MIFNVKLTLTTDQLGTVPKTQEIYDSYIKTRAKGKETKDEFASPLQESEVSAREAKGWTGFMMENGKPFVMDYFIRGFMKNAGNVLKAELGIKNLRSKIDNYLFIFPRKIFFKGTMGDSPLERPLRAQTAQGPRVSLVRSDVIQEGATLEFEIHVPYPCEIKEKHVKGMLDYGKYQGLGQFRNGGYGRFEYKLTESNKSKGHVKSMPVKVVASSLGM